MKNTFTLNIGLVTSEAYGKRPLDASHVLAVVSSHGFAHLVARHAIHTSNTEPTLVIELVSRDLPVDVLFAVRHLSDYLEQDCIAVLVTAENGATTGHLVGEKGAAWGPFNPEHFLLLDGRTLAQFDASAVSLLNALDA